MRKLITMMLLIFGTSLLAHAAAPAPSPAPEIDPGTAMSGLTLLAGAALIIRGRRSKK